MIEKTDYQVGDESFEVRCIQALDRDPLFDGADYTFAVESGERGFEVRVRVSEICANLLDMGQRRRLPEHAVKLVETLLETGCREDAIVRVSADGFALHEGRRIAELFPLRQPEAAVS